LKAALLLTAVLFLAGCHTHPFEITVENRTGAPVRLLEVDYPSASFGVNNLASGQASRNQLQLRGSGPVKVAYTAADGRPVQSSGPELAEPEEGRIEILLLPGQKVEFHPDFTPKP
jgi:hypothetical protein